MRPPRDFDARFTSDSAFEAAAQGQLDKWLQDYLRGPAGNPGLAEAVAPLISPAAPPVRVRLDLMDRIAGPSESPRGRSRFEWPVPPDEWDERVATIREEIARGYSHPPFVLAHAEGRFSIWDGNHRHEAMIRSGRLEHWAIVIDGQ